MEYVGNESTLTRNDHADRAGANGGGKDMPEKRGSVADLMQMVHAFEMSQVLHVTAKLGIADLLAAGPRTSDDLARATGTHTRSLYRLLRAVASVGALRQDAAGAFALTDLGQYLRTDHPQSVRGAAVYKGHPMLWGTWQHLLHSVTTGEPAFRHLHGVDPWEYRAQHAEAGVAFDNAASSATLQQRDAVVAGFDFSGVRTVVDVGGGYGTQLAGVLVANPHLRGVLFDQTHVLAGAEKVLREAGVMDRCDVVGGNFFEAVPDGGDVYLLSRVIHNWDDAQATVILRTCGRAMSPEARAVIIERVIAPGDGPNPVKYSDLNMLVMLGGQERTADEFADLYKAAGFRLTRVIPTAAGVSLIEGKPA